MPKADVIFIVDKQWKILSLNESAAQLLDLPKEDLQNSDLSNFIPQISGQSPDQITGEITCDVITRSKNIQSLNGQLVLMPQSEEYAVFLSSQNNATEGQLKLPQYKLLYDVAPIPIYSWRKIEEDYILIEHNNFALKYTRGLIKDFLGTKASQMYRDEPDILACFNRCFQTRQPVVWEGKYHFKVTERYRYVSVTFGFVPPDLITVYVEDITERKNAEESLKQSEAKWRSIAENAQDSIMLLDRDFNLLYINHTVGGLVKDRILGKPVHMLAPENQRQTIKACYQRVLETGIAERFESDYCEEDTCINFESWIAPIYQDNEISALIVNSRDVTEQKRLNMHIRLLLESTGDGIFGVDTDMRCTFINQSALTILGFSHQEIMGQDMYHVLNCTYDDGSPLDRKECPINLTMKNNASYGLEDGILWSKEGNDIPVEFSSNPIIENDVVTGAVVVFRNISETRAMAKKMDYLATHDTLTGLINRHEFEQRLEDAIELSHKTGMHHILCYLDLDQFKIVNDTCGHMAGDELLRQLGELLHRQVRHDDTFARLGGDEFGVLLMDCDIDNGIAIIEKLLQIVRDFRFVWKEQPFALGVSIGVVQISKETQNIGEAMINADSACYIAKESGRNRVHIYEVGDKDLAIRQGEMQWVTQIQQALENNRFVLYYQSILSNNSSQKEAYHSSVSFTSTHAEILIRMLGKGESIIPPGAFIPAAERYNLMSSIDRWVIKETFSWIKQSEKLVSHIDLFSINLSGHSIGDEQFMNYIVDLLEVLSIDASRICFEVTETAVVANLTRAIQFITRLKRIGCKFSLDDFGSGMSSFTYLKNLPVDFLKIDGNFVRDIAEDPIDRAMVEAINQVGQVMGIKTIAEFVENDTILQILKTIGVDYSQGYHIAKPRPLSEMLKG